MGFFFFFAITPNYHFIFYHQTCVAIIIKRNIFFVNLLKYFVFLSFSVILLFIILFIQKSGRKKKMQLQTKLTLHFLNNLLFKKGVLFLILITYKMKTSKLNLIYETHYVCVCLFVCLFSFFLPRCKVAEWYKADQMIAFFLDHCFMGFFSR